LRLELKVLNICKWFFLDSSSKNKGGKFAQNIYHISHTRKAAVLCLEEKQPLSYVVVLLQIFTF
jgi:hypothetical protein